MKARKPFRGELQAHVAKYMIKHGIKLNSDADLYTKALREAGASFRHLTGEDPDEATGHARQIANWLFNHDRAKDFREIADRLNQKPKAVATDRRKVNVAKVRKAATRKAAPRKEPIPEAQAA